MKVFIYEYVCGGGMADSALPTRLMAQGRAMLTAAATDFVDAGMEVVTSVDPRIELDIAGARVVGASHDNVFERITQQCDAVLVIAPECDGALADLVARVERLGVRSLGCRSDAVALCADKLRLSKHLQAAAVPTPPVAPFSKCGAGEYPVVIKPRDGAGCENTFYCRQSADVPDAMARDNGNSYIVQPFLNGMHASASLIVHGHRIVPLLAGRQRINVVEGRFCYEGGRIPLDAMLSERAFDLARRAVSAVNGLQGFVGVDVILGDDPGDDTVIEINPRLTVSYTVLRRLCKINLAAAMMDDRAVFDIEWADETVSFDSAGAKPEAVNR